MTATPVILVVEPSSFVRSSLRQWLEDVLTHYRILVAATGEEALRLTARERPTHILIETYLPDSPGFEVLQQMRQSLPAARIIATHWYESRLFLKQVRSAGADGFVPKHKLHSELLQLLAIAGDASHT
jgi:DNA-binding NarL/FixJ family response regulator